MVSPKVPKFCGYASLLLPLAARHAGRPSFSVWEPALLCSGFYLLLCLVSRFQSPVVMSFVLVFHGALILFSSPKPSEGAKGIETRAAIATKSHRLPRWAAATYFCVTAGLLASMIAAYTLGSVISTCTPCECTQEGVLTSCKIFQSAESLKLIRGLNAAPFTDRLNLAGKGIREIEPGAFSGLASLEELELQDNKLVQLRANTFKGLGLVSELHLEGNSLRKLSPRVSLAS